ncbi:hypothetical protein DOLIC_00074 [Dolichomitus sp. PSUC_FEM 10030005]|nr:hypothetical protein [Dolichomitus sp. PSUC_FEM 10030005]
MGYNIKIPDHSKFHTVQNLVPRILAGVHDRSMSVISIMAPLSRPLFIPRHRNINDFNDCMILHVNFRGKPYALPRHCSYWDIEGTIVRRSAGKDNKKFDAYDYQASRSIRFVNQTTGKDNYVKNINLSVTKNTMAILTLSNNGLEKNIIKLSDIKDQTRVNVIYLKFHKFTAWRDHPDTWFPSAYVQSMVLDARSSNS